MNIIVNNGNLAATNRKLQTPIETILTPGHNTHADLDALKATENSVPKLSHIFNSLRIALGVGASNAMSSA